MFRPRFLSQFEKLDGILTGSLDETPAFQISGTLQAIHCGLPIFLLLKTIFLIKTNEI